jgi:hypothetical protein
MEVYGVIECILCEKKGVIINIYVAENMEKVEPNTFIFLRENFTYLFEGETSNRVDLKYNKFTRKPFHAFYPYLYYFYLL